MDFKNLPKSKKREIVEILEERELRQERARQSGPGGLIRFVEYFWSVLEPNTPFVNGWVLEAICQHLEAVSRGEINRLLINVPPGFAKSLTCNTFWPLWEWSALGRSDHRYISFSYAAHLTHRDNRKMLSLLQSERFQRLWGNRPDLELVKSGEELIQNVGTGWKFASSVLGVGTGARGSRIILDDPHNVGEAESDLVRTGTVRWFREAMSNRLNNISKDAIVVIMQRVHEDDVSGNIISDPDGLGYTHLRVPMEFIPESMWSPASSIGWVDPRTDEEFRRVHGNLAWPERYPEASLRPFRTQPFMFAAQYQQDPEPRGGGIIKREWWRLWRPIGKGESEAGDGCPHCGSNNTKHLEGRGMLFECGGCGQKFRGKTARFPICSYVLASLDCAYTEKERNDPSAMTVWGVFSHPTTKEGGVMLMDAWQKWLKIRGRDVPRLAGEDDAAWRARAEPEWGLVEWTQHTARKFKASCLLIENKASGISLQQELRLQHSRELWTTELVNPEGDKEARAYSIQGIFAQGLVWAPNRNWADMTIDQCAKFPFGRHDDIVDSMTMALRRLRDMRLLEFEDERLADQAEGARYEKNQRLAPLYPV